MAAVRSSGASSAAPAGDAAVRAVQLTKRFGAKIAVQDVTLTVPRGAVFGLVGPNGAGKTTTVTVLAHYLRPSAGRVEVLGFAATAVRSLRSRIGVLPQDSLLPPQETVGKFLLQ